MSNLIQVSAMVGNIRNMANDMNTALVRQNQTLDRINAKDASDIQRVKMANERAAALCNCFRSSLSIHSLILCRSLSP